MRNERFKTLAVVLLCMVGVSSCSGDEEEKQQPEPTQETAVFAKGADVSWLTEMEAAGKKFYDASGQEQECMSLLKSLGVNAIRLRVWVNPEGGYNGKQDVLQKALRAKALGLRLMIDFHYSDTWADPSKQTPPAAWAGHGITELKQDVADHTRDVLQTLKDNGVDVEWVQVGNETSSGMLWEVGRASGTTFSSFAALITAGYDAVKSVFPQAKVIVHLDRGQELTHLTWMFGGLKSSGAKYDAIGLSLYPEPSNWQSYTTQCLANIRTLISTYDKDVVVCEIGMSWDAASASDFVSTLLSGCRNIDRCTGLFYWEPECYGSWNGYTKGAFDASGRPTAALDAFKE